MFGTLSTCSVLYKEVYDMLINTVFLSQRFNLSFTDRFSLPWPQRLFDCEQFVVELLVTSTVDVESRCTSRLIMDGNYHASLHWYGSDGTQKKLDIRRLVRKQLRQVERK